MLSRVLLVDSQRMVRDSLGAFLEAQENIEVVDVAETGLQAVELGRKLRPDLIIMNVQLPELNGPGATREILSTNSSIRIVAIGARHDDSLLREMREAGAHALLLKTCGTDDLLYAVNSVIAGETYISPSVADHLISSYCNNASSASVVGYMLSGRERQVLQMLSEGFCAKEIGRRLSVSDRTIHTHRQRIMKKVDVHTLAGLVKVAIRMGLTNIYN